MEIFSLADEKEPRTETSDASRERSKRIGREDSAIPIDSSLGYHFRCSCLLAHSAYSSVEHPMAIAYFLTFTTYGTWLHGTDKGFGSVDNDHNRFDSPYIAPNTHRVADDRARMTDNVYRLDAPRREVVRDAIVAISAEKGWRLWAVHVRSNHVHVVITAEREPGRLMADLKARASGALPKAGFEASDRCRWTRHGSTQHLFTEDKLAEKIRYTLDEQGERMAHHDGRPKSI